MDVALSEMLIGLALLACGGQIAWVAHRQPSRDPGRPSPLTALALALTLVLTGLLHLGQATRLADGWPVPGLKVCIALATLATAVLLLARWPGMPPPTRRPGAPPGLPETREWSEPGPAQGLDERPEAQAALRQSEQRLALVLEAGQLGFWDWDLPSGRVLFSGRWASMLGYELDAIEPNVAAWERLIHPDDAAGAARLLTDHLEGRTPFYACEHRLKHKDGSWRWILDRGQVVERDAQGRPLRAVGTHADVTDRHRIDEALRASERRERERAEELEVLMQAVPAAIFVSHDPDCQQIQGNPEAYRLLGWPEQSNVSASSRPRGPVQPRAFQEYRDGQPVPVDQLPMQLAARAGVEVRDTELTFRFDDGDQRHIFGHAVPLRHPDGTVRGALGAFVDITELKRAEALIQAEEKRYRLMAEAIPIGMILANAGGAVDYCNPAYSALTGYSHEDFESGRVSWKSITPPEWLHLDEVALAEARVHGVCTPYEKEYLRPDGARVPVLVGFALLEPERQKSIAFIVDLSVQRRAEQQFHTLADHISQLVWMAEPDGQISWYNQRWYEYTGTDLETMRGEGWRTVHHPEHLERVVAGYTRAIAAGTAWEDTFPLRGRDGTYRWFLSRALPIRDAGGRIVHWFGTNTDVSDQRTAQEERERLLVATEAARAEAETANRAKDEFLAILSHELRTPLNAIVGWAKLLSLGPVEPDDLTEGIAAIERNAIAQARLVDDLLDISRIISGKLHLELRPLEPAGPIEGALAAVTPAAAAKGIRLEAQLDPHVGAVAADPSRLQQIVWNLLSNAVKFTGQGGRVVVRLQRTEAGVQIEVQDTGAGIEPAFLPRVFEPFQQADSTTTRRHGGLGLGLAIVKQLAELHGGTVRAASAGTGQGATFTLTLPPLATTAVAPGHPAAQTPTGRLAGLRVLVVDDEPDARALLRKVLSRQGAQVTLASSVPEALESLASAPPDVLLSDISMPDADGYELLRQVRVTTPPSALPAAALTAFARGEDRQQALAAGFQMHVAKPVDPSTLIDIVAELAGRAESLSALQA